MGKDSNTSLNTDINAAMTAFVARTKTRQLAILMAMVSAAEAEEILQEAYLKIFLLVNEGKAETSPLAHFLSLQPMLNTVVRHLAITTIRHQKVVKAHAVNSAVQLQENSRSASVNTENVVMHNDDKEALLSAINQLPPICRQVFVQRKIYGRSHSEIADMLGISTKTVENHLTKGLLLCRKNLRQQESVHFHAKVNTK